MLQVEGGATMTSWSVLAMIGLSGVFVFACMGIAIHFDIAARSERFRLEWRVRRGAAQLLQEAERARR